MTNQNDLQKSLTDAHKSLAVAKHLLTQFKVTPDVVQGAEALFADFQPVVYNGQVVNFQPTDAQNVQMKTMLAQGVQTPTQEATKQVTVQEPGKQPVQQQTQQPTTVEQMMPMMMMAMMQKMMGGDVQNQPGAGNPATVPGGIKPNGAVGGALSREAVAKMSQSEIASNWDAISAAMASGALNAT